MSDSFWTSSTESEIRDAAIQPILDTSAFLALSLAIVGFGSLKVWASASAAFDVYVGGRVL